MRICIIAEGCYPYVAGGVSSWIQMLIKGMPEHEFVIVAIGAQESQRGKFKYEIPENVTEIIEYFLDTYEKISAKPNNRISISEVQKKTFLKFLQGESFDWKNLHVSVVEMDGRRVKKIQIVAEETADALT